MANIVIDAERCKGCELCMHFCPKKLIGVSEEFNSRGVHPCEFHDEGKCTGCTICAMMCPDVAIEVYK